MGRGKIVVETTQLDQTATRVENLAGTYNTTYTKLFQTVQGMKTVYGGKDSEAFITQIEGFQDDFERMETLMKDYATYIRKVAKAYRDTQDNIVSSAKTLSQGS